MYIFKKAALVLLAYLILSGVAVAAPKNQTTQSTATAFAATTQYITVNSTTPGGGQAITITAPNGATYSAYLHLPSDYDTSSKTYPLLVFLHGMGEAGTDLSLIYNNGYAGGPAYLVEHGQFGSYANQFIVLAPQATYFSTHGDALNNLLKGFVPSYRVDTNRLYLTGLSAGGQGITEYMVHPTWTNQYTAAAAVPMSEAWYYPSGSAQTIVNDKVYNWGFGSDPEDKFGVLTHNLMNEISAISPGMSRYTNYSGGHCCWNTFYNTGYTESVGGTSMNIYQWLLQYVRGGSNPTPVNQSPTANAGADQTITLPTSSVTLSGSGSDPDGTITNYAWTKVSGGTAIIGSPSAASTNVTGLAQGSYTFRLTVTDNQGATATDTVNVTVNAAPAPTTNTPYGGTAWAIPGTIQAEDYDLGGEGIAYHDVDPGNATGVYRPSEGVDLSTTADTGGGYLVGWISADEWQKYSINVASSGTYTLQARLAGYGGSFRVEIDGTTIATISAPSTYGWDTWQTVSVPNVALSSGSHVMRLYTLASGYNINWISFTTVTAPANQAPSANAGADQTITLPTSSVTLSGSGTDPDGSISSYAWSQVSGPSTATIASATSASASASNLVQGTYTFRLKVTDNAGATDTDDMTVAVNAAPVTSQTAIYNIDFGSSGNQTPGWNNIADPSYTGVATALVDTNGVVSAHRMQITDAFYSTAVNTNGTTASSVFPASATGDSFFLGTLNSVTDTSAAINLTGLNDANTYDFRFYASRLAGDTANRTTVYTIGGKTVTLNVTNNINTYADITNVTPSNGSVTIAIAKDAAAIYGYLGVLQITERAGTSPTPSNQSPIANAGADQTITLPTSSVTLSGSGTDPDGSISSYAWSQVSGPSTATIASATSASASASNLVQGTYTFRLKVTDNAGATDTDDMTVAVNAAPVTPGTSGPYGGTAWAIPGTIQAEDFDLGGEGVGYHDLYDSGNKGGQYRTSESVDIEKASDTSGVYDVGWVVTGEWLKYSVNVQTSGTYTFNTRIAAPGAAVGFNMEIDGTKVATVAAPQTGGYQSWQTVSVPNISLTAGAHTMKINILSYGFNLNYFTFESTGSTTPPPSTSGGNPYGGTPWAVPGTIQAENYDLGGEGVGYHDVWDTTNQGGQYRTDTVDIEKASDTSGVYDVGWINAGEWMNYTINVQTADTYTLLARIATPWTDKTITVDVDGIAQGTIAVPQTGSWQAWQSTTLSNISLSKGVHTLKLSFPSGGINLNYVTLTNGSVLGASISAADGCMPGAIFSFTTGQPCQALTSNELTVIVNSKSPLNVRSIPQSGSIIGKVSPGMIGTVLVDSATWPKVQFSNGVAGYVSRAYISLYNKPY